MATLYIETNRPTVAGKTIWCQRNLKKKGIQKDQINVVGNKKEKVEIYVDDELEFVISFADKDEDLAKFNGADFSKVYVNIDVQDHNITKEAIDTLLAQTDLLV